MRYITIVITHRDSHQFPSVPISLFCAAVHYPVRKEQFGCARFCLPQHRQRADSSDAHANARASRHSRPRAPITSAVLTNGRAEWRDPLSSSRRRRSRAPPDSEALNEKRLNRPLSWTRRPFEMMRFSWFTCSSSRGRLVRAKRCRSRWMERWSASGRCASPFHRATLIMYFHFVSFKKRQCAFRTLIRASGWARDLSTLANKSGLRDCFIAHGGFYRRWTRFRCRDAEQYHFKSGDDLVTLGVVLLASLNNTVLLIN